MKNKIHIAPIILIAISSFFVRILIVNFDEPLNFDALKYFIFASEVATTNNIPIEYSQSTVFWQILLSLIFEKLDFQSTLDYMNIQKIFSVILSSLTIIPLYFLLKTFFKYKVIIFGLLIFCFEPRLIINAHLGITEPLYLLFGVTTFALFLSKNRGMIFSSFISSALAVITRSEGQMIFYGILIFSIIKFRTNKKIILEFLLGIIIFFIIIFPVMNYQNSFLGYDGIFGKAIHTIEFHSDEENNPNKESGNLFFVNGIINFAKFFIWGLFPLMIFLFIPGLFLFIKKINSDKIFLIVIGILLCIPAIYEYGIPLEDSRYLFMIYPILIVICLSFIEKILEKYDRKTIYFLICSLIIISGILFLNYQIQNDKEKYEIYEIFKNEIPEKVVINQIYPYSEFFKNEKLPKQWVDLKNLIKEKRHFDFIKSSSNNIVSHTEDISFEEFIRKNSNLTHLIIDEDNTKKSILKEILMHQTDKKFEKIFDSKELGFTSNVKVFLIIREN